MHRAIVVWSLSLTLGVCGVRNDVAAQTNSVDATRAAVARAADLLAARRPQDASDLLEGILASDPSQARAWFHRALASQALDHPSRAVEAFERAMSLDPRMLSRPPLRAVEWEARILRARCGTSRLTRLDASLSRRGLPGWVVPVSVVGGVLVAAGVTTAIVLGTQTTPTEITNWGVIKEPARQ